MSTQPMSVTFLPASAVLKQLQVCVRSMLTCIKNSKGYILNFLPRRTRKNEGFILTDFLPCSRERCGVNSHASSYFPEKTNCIMFKRIFFLALCSLALAGLPMVAQAQQRGRSSTTADAGYTTVVVRCSYWTEPGQVRKTEPLFYLDGREYLPFVITDMAFVRAYEYRGPNPMILYRKATPEEILQRQAEGVSKSELEYIPYAKIPFPSGMRDVGVLIPGDVQTASPVVFDFSENVFPLGSMMVLNMCNFPLQMGLAPSRSKAQTMAPQAVQLPAKGRWVTKAVKERIPLNIRAAVPAKGEASGWKTVFSSSGIFRPTTRSVLFVMPSAQAQKSDDGLPAVQFRQASVAQKPVAPPPSVDDEDTKKSRKGAKGDTDDKKKEKKPARPKPRRV